MINKPAGKNTLYWVVECQKTNAYKDKSKREAEEQLHCDGSVWILYSQAEEWFWEISREAHKAQMRGKREEQPREGTSWIVFLHTLTGFP